MIAHVGRHLNSEFPDDRYRSTRSAATVSSLVRYTHADEVPNGSSKNR